MPGWPPIEGQHQSKLIAVHAQQACPSVLIVISCLLPRAPSIKKKISHLHFVFFVFPCPTAEGSSAPASRGTVAGLSAHLRLTDRLQQRLVEFMVLVASRHMTHADIAPVIR